MPSESNAVKISLVLAFTALNLTIGGIVSWLKLPVYLDSLGIVMATILLGWRYGLICAFLTVALGFVFINPYLPFYALTSFAIAATVEILRRWNMYRNIGTTILSALVLAIVAAFVSAPVTAFAFGGVTASGVSLLTALFRQTGRSLIEAVLLSGISSEPVDKLLVSLAAFLSLKGLPNRFLEEFGLRGVSELDKRTQ